MSIPTITGPIKYTEVLKKLYLQERKIDLPLNDRVLAGCVALEMQLTRTTGDLHDPHSVIRTHDIIRDNLELLGSDRDASQWLTTFNPQFATVSEKLNKVEFTLNALRTEYAKLIEKVDKNVREWLLQYVRKQKDPKEILGHLMQYREELKILKDSIGRYNQTQSSLMSDQRDLHRAVKDAVVNSPTLRKKVAQTTEPPHRLGGSGTT